MSITSPTKCYHMTQNYNVDQNLVIAGLLWEKLPKLQLHKRIWLEENNIFEGCLWCKLKNIGLGLANP